jgi:hypothetical protein
VGDHAGILGAVVFIFIFILNVKKGQSKQAIGLEKKSKKFEGNTSESESVNISK